MDADPVPDAVLEDVVLPHTMHTPEGQILEAGTWRSHCPIVWWHFEHIRDCVTLMPVTVMSPLAMDSV